MLHIVAFHQGLSTLFVKTKMIFREKLQFCLEIKTCDPLNYTMHHSKLIASIQIEEFIRSFKSSANYYIQLLYFQRCIVMRLFYFSYKQVKHDFSLLSAYAIICGRFNITVN